MVEEKPLRHIDFDDVTNRADGLGGSDSPVVLGVYPFKTRKDLWLEKLGLTPPQEETPAIKRGRTLESIVADLYAEIKGRQISIVKQRLTHPKWPFIFAHIDRRISDPGKERGKSGDGILEIKCPGMGIFTKCEREGLPEYYVVQLQHYLGVTGKEWGAFAVFSAEKWKLIEFDVRRDDQLIKLIFDRDREFWEQVKNGIEPVDEAVHIDMPEVQKGDLVNMDRSVHAAEWAEAVKQYQIADNLLKEADGLKNLAEERLKAGMTQAGARIAEGSGARIYWKEQAGKNTLDKKAFARESPEAYRIYESYLNPGKPSRPFRAYFPRPILIE